MSDQGSKIEQRTGSLTRVAILIFILAFSVRLTLMLVTRAYNQPLRVEIHHLAYSITAGQGYGNPYPIATGPTAIYSPGCPLIIAAIYLIFGTGTLAEAITYIANITAASTAFALLPFLATFLGLSRRIGTLAGLCGALLPTYLLNEFRSTTATFTALCLIGLTLLTAWLQRGKHSFTPRLGFLVGIAWGLALLIAPNLLLVGLVWLATLLLRYRAQALRFSIAALATVLVILSPWAIRNQIVLGSPIFSRSNLGLELWIANNDVAAAAYGDNNASHDLYQPFVNAQESERVRAFGEVAYMREKLAAAESWIGQHPQRFLQLTADRVLHFWFPIAFRPAQTLVLRTLAIAGLIGLAFTWIRQRTAFWILGSIWLVFPLVYYFVQLDNPYRYPLYWSVLLLAVYGCACSLEFLRDPSPTIARRFPLRDSAAVSSHAKTSL